MPETILNGRPVRRHAQTVKRDRNRCRVVVTFDVEITDEALLRMPAWKRHARNFFQDLRDMSVSPQAMMNTMRRRKSTIIIHSETVDIAP